MTTGFCPKRSNWKYSWRKCFATINPNGFRETRGDFQGVQEHSQIDPGSILEFSCFDKKMTFSDPNLSAVQGFRSTAGNGTKQTIRIRTICEIRNRELSDRGTLWSSKWQKKVPKRARGFPKGRLPDFAQRDTLEGIREENDSHHVLCSSQLRLPTPLVHTSFKFLF